MTIAPATIGPYVVSREIGRGGMGVVYLARDPHLQRDVAVKSLPDESAQDESRMQGLLHEARALAQVRSPHIASIYHLLEDQGRRYLILEFVEGVSLFQKLQEGTPPLRHALQWAVQVAMALEAAHARGIIHRDLKPGNIMITPANHARVLDFGLSKLLAAPDHHSEATTREDVGDVAHGAGAKAGTPGYLSPEQARGEPLDRRADIWSFGCVLFEMVTGGRAFAGRTPHDAISAVLRDEPEYDAISHIVPQRVRDLLRRCLAKDVDRRLRDIGDARLEIEEVLAPSLQPAETPPIPNDLPAEVTRFIGRLSAIEAVGEFLKSHRLVTLHGWGGSGKTRLALRVAREVMSQFPDGVWFIELASVSDAALIASSIVEAIGLKGEKSTPADALIAHLHDQRALIVLDNCEHLIAGCAALAESILKNCADVRILTTSREPLRIAGEQCYEVEAMDLPSATSTNPDDIARHEAVELLVERAQQVRQEFSINQSNARSVAEICRRLDGIPLAIELAAARLRALAPEEILARLEGLDFLSRGPRGQVDRHRTLRGAIDWSYTLLTEGERTLFRRLSVFRGGWTLAAAESVGRVGGDLDEPIIELLEALIEKSLVLLDEREAAGPRYRMLEVIRQYAEERSAMAGELDRSRAAHLQWCLLLAEEAEPDLSAGRDQQRWLPILATEHDNMRAALQCGLESTVHDDRGPRLAVALLNLWYLRAYFAEGRRWYRLAVEHLGEASADLRARCHLGAGVLAWTQGDYRAARSDYEESLRISKHTGNEERCAAILTNLGMAIFEAERNCAAARACLEESLGIYSKRQRLDRIPMVQLNLAAVAIAEERYEAAEELLVACQLAFQRSGDHNRLGFTYFNLARAALRQGKLEHAMKACEKAAGIAKDLQIDGLMAPTMSIVAAIASAAGDHETSIRVWSGALMIDERLGVTSPEADIEELRASNLGAARRHLGDATFEAIWNCAKESDPVAIAESGLERLRIHA